MIPLAVTGIRFYQRFLSPALSCLLAGRGWGCRFFPTCSAYLDSALRQYGLVTGFMLFSKRLARCHPWGGSGYDPLPSANNEFGANIRIRTFVQDS